MEVTNCSYSS